MFAFFLCAAQTPCCASIYLALDDDDKRSVCLFVCVCLLACVFNPGKAKLGQIIPFGFQTLWLTDCIPKCTFCMSLEIIIVLFFYFIIFNLKNVFYVLLIIGSEKCDKSQTHTLCAAQIFLKVQLVLPTDLFTFCPWWWCGRNQAKNSYWMQKS